MASWRVFFPWFDLVLAFGTLYLEAGDFPSAVLFGVVFLNLEMTPPGSVIKGVA